MIGYIGLGNIGGPISKALATSHQMMVYDLNPEAVASCTYAGARAASDLHEMARECPVIFLCLPSIKSVLSLLAPGGAFVGAMAEGTLIVDQTTSDPEAFTALADTLASRSVHLIDAPISGGAQGVHDRTLLITIGGTVTQFDIASGILRRVSEKILHTGPVGTAMTIKVANNYLAASQAAIALQVTAFAATRGCDPETTACALSLGSGQNYYVDNYLKTHVIPGKLESAASIDVMRKDIALAITLAKAAGLPLLGESELRALIDKCIATYGPSAPYNAIALTISDVSGVPIGHCVGETTRKDR